MKKGNLVKSKGKKTSERKKAFKSLEKNENKLQISLDYMIEGCQIIDFDWRYAYVNEAVANQGRRTKKELLGHTMMEMYPGIERTEMFGHLQNCMTKRVSHEMENEFTFPDGSKGWFELRIEPVPVGLLILSIDITKRKQLNEELDKYQRRLEQVVAQKTAECAGANEELKRKIHELTRVEQALQLRAAILDNVKEAIFLANPKGDLLYANAAASEAYGFNLDQFLNMNIRSLFQPEDALSVDLLLGFVVKERGTSLEMIHLNKAGSKMTVKVYSDLLQTPQGKFIVFVIRRINVR